MCLQLIARGILLPEDPSSDSVSASDLDFSNLSLDSGMDRLSRLADSLVEGMTPGSLGLARDATAGFSSQEGAQGAPHRLSAARDDKSKSSISGLAEGLTAGRQLECQKATAGSSSSDKSSSQNEQTAAQRQPKATDAHSHMAAQSLYDPVRAEPSCLSFESASEASWLQTGTGNQTDSSRHGSPADAQHHKTDDPIYMQPRQRHMTHHERQMPSARPAAVSVQMSEAYADTDSLCRHSLPHQQRTSVPESAGAEFDLAAQHASESPVLQSNNTEPPHGPECVSGSEAKPSADAEEVSATEADSPLPADRNASPHHASADDQESLEDDPGRQAESPAGHRSFSPQHEQQEGLLSDSENDFEKSLLTARLLRPTNAASGADRYCLLPFSVFVLHPIIPQSSRAAWPVTVCMHVPHCTSMQLNIPRIEDQLLCQGLYSPAVKSKRGTSCFRCPVYCEDGNKHWSRRSFQHHFPANSNRLCC